MFNAIIMTMISVDHFPEKIVKKSGQRIYKNVIPTDAKLWYKCNNWNLQKEQKVQRQKSAYDIDQPTTKLHKIKRHESWQLVSLIDEFDHQL